jgi:tetratricopeptide (TPR) repeat protein
MANRPISLLIFRGRGLLVAVLVAIALAATGCPRASVDAGKSATRLDLAKDFLGQGQLDAAEQEANKALGFNPRNEEAYNVLGLIRVIRALSAFRLLEIDDCLTGIDAEVHRADLDQHLLAADERFVEAVRLADDFGEAWANRGLVAIQLGDYAAAIRYLRKALTVPQRLENAALVRANLGWAHFHLDDMVSAAKELRQAIQFHPGMCIATYRLGRVYFARKEWEKAHDQFAQVVGQADCPIQEAHLFLMRTHVELGNAESLANAQNDCVALAQRSCVAAQCRQVVHQAPSQGSAVAPRSN